MTRVAQHRDERRAARTTTDTQRRRIAGPHEPAADRSLDLHFVTRLHDIGKEAADLSLVQAFHEKLEERVVGRRNDRVRPLSHVPVGRGEPDDVMLPGEVIYPIRYL